MDYTVRSGDTLSQIAKQYGVNYMDIAKTNNIADPNRIYANQLLKIPGSSPAPAAPAVPAVPTMTKADELINNASKYLQPAKPYEQVQSFDQYAAPQQEVYNQWLAQMARPEFEKYTLAPFEESYANAAAAGGNAMMGNAANNYDIASKGVRTPFENQLAQAQSSYENMLRQGYNKRIQDYYNNVLTGYNPNV